VVLEEIRRGEGAGGGVGAVVRTTASRAMRARSLSSEDEEKEGGGGPKGYGPRWVPSCLGLRWREKMGQKEGRWTGVGSGQREKREGKPGKVG
jgi:hypothetical protein